MSGRNRNLLRKQKSRTLRKIRQRIKSATTAPSIKRKRAKQLAKKLKGN